MAKWDKFKETQYTLKTNQQSGKYELFELVARNLHPKGQKPTQNQLTTFFGKRVPRAISSVTSKAGGDFSFFFLSKEARDAFDKTIDVVPGGVRFSFEAFPPHDTPFWKPAPTIVSTRMRLVKVDPTIPLEAIEEVLQASIKSYIKDSVMFETYAGERTWRNGNVTFYVKGTATGTPWQHLRVLGCDLRMENPARPNHPDGDIPASSASPPPPATSAAPEISTTSSFQATTAPKPAPPKAGEPSSQKAQSKPVTAVNATQTAANNTPSKAAPKRAAPENEWTVVGGKKSKGINKGKGKENSEMEMDSDHKDKPTTSASSSSQPQPQPQLSQAETFAAVHAAYWSNDQ